MTRILLALTAAVFTLGAAHADAIKQTKAPFDDKFRQLDVDLPTPNVYRNAAGAPGPDYWQQKVDYEIDATLDTENKRIIATQTVRYTNNSPDTLPYIWFQLDQNRFDNASAARLTETARTDGNGGDRLSFYALAREYALRDVDYGFDIVSITDGRGADIPFKIVDTHMRLDLPRPLASGRTQTVVIAWEHDIINEDTVGGRGGYEEFPADEDAGVPATYQYFLAQWFPRATAYTDYGGWLHKAFLGRGEFTLEFGDYEVSLTVPADHIVASTGELQNPQAVLTAEQRSRLAEAEDADAPVFIVTPAEARENEKEESSDTKTWVFTAENVRDFAWVSSNKYIWDAQGYEQADGPDVMAMSFYPNEAEPLWSLYSTASVIHTMEVYSRFSFPYPYPTAQSVNTWAGGGMEYPMITFNGYRPSIDEETGERTYSRRTKYGLIGVIIHEIGHIYFPMIVNTDERQWTWMDEGINTFLEYMAEVEWEDGFAAFGRNANLLDYIPGYMTSQNQVPIMTQSDSVLQFGPNAYSKPAAALTILRETVLGPELFDDAFREYANRWRFRRPTPSDFFRTMEDASGVDLDWFWRGWFYSTDHVDLAITGVREYQISTRDPDVEYPRNRERTNATTPPPLTSLQNRDAGRTTLVEREPDLTDLYTENDRFTVSNADRNAYMAFLDGLEDWERATLDRALEEAEYFYFVDVENLGGLVMPIPMQLTFEDGSTQEQQLPAEIWRRSPDAITRLFITPQRVTAFELDVRHQLADADHSNNAYPSRIAPSRLDLYKRGPRSSRNLMADMMVELKGAETEEEASEDAPLTPVEDGAGE